MPTLDEIYGVSLQEYCDKHGLTIDQLVQKKKTDIFLLKSRLHHLVYHAPQSTENDELVAEVKKLLDKKRISLERLLSWKELSCRNQDSS